MKASDFRSFTLVSLNPCPRCQGNHDNITFSLIPDYNHPITHSATCPVNGHTIFFRTGFPGDLIDPPSSPSGGAKALRLQPGILLLKFLNRLLKRPHPHLAIPPPRGDSAKTRHENPDNNLINHNSLPVAGHSTK